MTCYCNKDKSLLNNETYSINTFNLESILILNKLWDIMNPSISANPRFFSFKQQAIINPKHNTIIRKI